VVGRAILLVGRLARHCVGLIAERLGLRVGFSTFSSRQQAAGTGAPGARMAGATGSYTCVLDGRELVGRRRPTPTCDPVPGRRPGNPLTLEPLTDTPRTRLVRGLTRACVFADCVGFPACLTGAWDVTAWCVVARSFCCGGARGGSCAPVVIGLVCARVASIRVASFQRCD